MYKILGPYIQLIEMPDVCFVMGDVHFPVERFEGMLKSLPVVAGELIDGECAASLPEQAGGVGDVVGEVFLVDVDADTCDGVEESLPIQMMFDEDAGQLVSADIYVVGPFDVHFWQIIHQELTCGKSEILVEEELSGSRCLGGEVHGEEDVLSAFAEPLVAAHAAPLGLEVGKYCCEWCQGSLTLESFHCLLREPLVRGCEVWYEL